jgi:trimethylamine--corrinoid protein Co-methyltransferase
MLTTSDIERIDRAARALLEDPGIRVEDDEVVGRLLSCGAKPGSAAQVVRFPATMVKEYLSLVPERFSLGDRKGGRKEVSPDGNSTFWTAAALFYLDRQGFRPIAQKDLADLAWVIENLAEVDVIVGTATEDTAPPHRDFVGFRIMAENTRKHLRPLSFTPRGGEAMVEMARVLAGGRPLRENPLFSIGFTAHGPLRWTNLALGVFKATAGHGIPCTVNGEPMAGATSPVTLAGTTVVGAAEILSGIIINQVLEPGRPCFFNLGFAHVMDMRFGFAVTGAPENCLFAVAGAELARFYRVPSASWICSDSLGYDAQNAMEKTLAALTHAQARVSAVWGIGSFESEKTISPVQAVIDDEIVRMVRKYLAGIPVNEETIALDEIRRVGITGEFMSSPHTYKHFRGNIFEPRLGIRLPRPNAGARDNLIARAEDRVEALLAAPRPSTMDEQTRNELLKIEARYSQT